MQKNRIIMSNLKSYLLKVCFLVACCSLSVFSKAQTQDSLLKKHQFKAGIKLVGVGATYERRLNKSLTLYSEASVNLAETTVFYYNPGIDFCSLFRHCCAVGAVWCNYTTKTGHFNFINFYLRINLSIL